MPADSVANLLLRITGDSGDGEQALEELIDRLAELEATNAEANADVDTGDAQAHLEQLIQQLAELDGSTSTADIDVDTVAAVAEIIRLKQEIEQLDNETIDVKVDVDKDGAAKAGVDSLMASMKGLLNQAVAITAVGLALQAIGGLAGIFIALASAIAPATGALAAFASAGTAVAQGMGVLKLGMLGVSDAVSKEVGKAFKETTPAANEFARFIKGFVPDLVHLRNIAQGPLLRGLTDGIKSASGNFGVLNPIIRETANAVADLMRGFGEFVGSPGFGKDLAVLGRRNVELIKLFGDTAGNLGKALVNVIIAAGPLTMWLARLAQGWSQSILGASEAGRASGSTAAFFEKTREVLSRLFSILGSVGSLFSSVGRAGYSLGSDILAGVDRALEALARLAKSAEGQTALTDYFNKLRPLVDEVGLLIVDLAKAFADLGTQPGLVKLISTFRTELLPVLVSVIDTTTQSFGPAFIDAAANVVRLIAPIMGSSGPLVIFVRALGGIAGALADIVQTVPGASAGLTTIIGLAAVYKAALILGKFTGITALITALRSLAAAHNMSILAALRHQAAIILVTAAWKAHAVATALSSAVIAVWTALTNGAALAAIRARIAMAAAVVILGVQTVATWLAVAATTALTVVMAILTSPILLVIAAIVALVGVGYLLIKNWDTVKQVLGAVWGFLRDLASTVFNAVGSAISAATHAVASVIKSVWEAIGSFLSGLWKGIASAASSVWNGIKSVVSTVVHAIGSVISSVWNAIGSATSTVWNAIKALITSVVNGIVSVVTSVLGALGSAVSGIWNGIKSTASTIWGGIKATVTGVVDGLSSAVGGTLRSLRDTVGDIWDSIKSTATKAWNAVEDAITKPIKNGLAFIRGLVGDFRNAGSNLIEAVKDGIVSAAEKVYEAVRAVARKARDLIPFSEPKDPSSPFRGLSKGGQAIMENLAEGIPRGAQTLVQTIAAELGGLQLNNLSPAAVATGAGGNTYNIERHYHLPPGPGGGLEPTFAASQLDNLLRNEGAL